MQWYMLHILHIQCLNEFSNHFPKAQLAKRSTLSQQTAWTGFGHSLQALFW